MEIPTRFWKEYISSEGFERRKKVEVIAEKISNLFNIKQPTLRKDAIATILQGYFDDILNYFYISSNSDSESSDNSNNNVTTTENKSSLSKSDNSSIFES